MVRVEPPPDLEVRALAAGPPEMVLVAFSATGASTLTAVECEIAIAVVRGLTNAQIAEERRVAVRTVANQIASIFTKLGVSSRAELAATLTVEHLR